MAGENLLDRVEPDRIIPTNEHRNGGRIAEIFAGSDNFRGERSWRPCIFRQRRAFVIDDLRALEDIAIEPLAERFRVRPKSS